MGRQKRPGAERQVPVTHVLWELELHLQPEPGASGRTESPQGQKACSQTTSQPSEFAEVLQEWALAPSQEEPDKGEDRGWDETCGNRIFG